ncbi:MAG TPA: 3-hydroxyacyl-CoA dehydrogenase NAD-binding domain-containing protein, partial [Rhabdaerophilum sp.]|nr:3-hydroxyacyl-CoA dehydrogenase NAD-binding domain-containing protein [Rhabdaerophilum sp.]
MRREGRVAIIEIDNPPVNALSNDVRANLLRSVQEAVADRDVDAMVIAGAGRTFCAGAEIREFGTPPLSPLLPDLIDAIETVEKPVVAAVRGVAFGGGFEIALGAHARVAAPDARFALPEVKLGLIPGAGGTQRLPRLIGLVKSARLIASGDSVDAAEAKALGIVDAVIEGDLLAAAVARATEMATTKSPLRRLSREETVLAADRADPAAFEAEAAAILKRARGLDAPAGVVEALRNALTLSFAEGMKREREIFVRLRDGEQSKAQRHLFFAERAALKVKGIGKDVKPRAVRRVAVLGAGTMGGGIAMCFASAGIPVTIVDPNPEALQRGMGVVEGNYRASAKRGSMSSEAVDAALALLKGSSDFNVVAEADLVIEAVFEDMALKKRIFADLDRLTKPGTVLATNTSSLDINEIATATSRPGDVLGMHFFSPANVMKLLEVVRAGKSAPDALATAIDVGAKIGKVPVTVGVCYGFVGNRMLHARGRQVEALLVEGAAPKDIDAAATAFGYAMGPCAVGDLAGLDVGWRIRKESGAKAPVADAICELGRFGQKTGAGYYRYEPGNRTPIPDPEIDALIERIAVEKGIARRPISHEEIEERLAFSMVNEAARILEEGIAYRPGD